MKRVTAEQCRGARLLLALGGRARLAPLIDQFDDEEIVALVKPGEDEEWRDVRTLPLEFRPDAQHADFRRGCLRPGFLAELRTLGFASVVVPSFRPTTWRDNALEVLAADIADTVEIVPLAGHPRRRYTGESLHRLIYNKAYLASMLSAVPDPAGQRVLEVGCSDGLACDLLAQWGAASVSGVDLWTENIGSEYMSEATDFRRGDATSLGYADQSFDLTYSIATFEHLAQPWAVLEEMLRVTKVGGCLYVQAGPLYHSPFGHHMFCCFADLPWAHLRLSPDELVTRIRETDHAETIWREAGHTPEDYVNHMLSHSHINGLFLSDYRLEEFAAAHSAEVLKYTISYEGRELLTPAIEMELSRFPAEQLVEHGFEFCIRRTT